jgi:hypothetical protein
MLRESSVISDDFAVVRAQSNVALNLPVPRQCILSRKALVRCAWMMVALQPILALATGADISPAGNGAASGAYAAAADTRRESVAATASADGPSTEASGDRAQGRASSNPTSPQPGEDHAAMCTRLQNDVNVSPQETVKAGCEVTQAQINIILNNPIANLIAVPLQYDQLRVANIAGRAADQNATHVQLYPQFPVIIGDVSWVTRVDFNWLSVPYRPAAAQLVGLTPQQIFQNPKLLEIAADTSGRTTGYSDTGLVSVAGPRISPKLGDGNFIWAVGGTAILPTAENKLLGYGKYSVGPAVGVAWLSPAWRLAFLAQQWWDVGGQKDRATFNQMNLQYFAFYAPNEVVAIGMSPNIVCDWTQKSGSKCTVPVGMGFNWIQKVGPLPVRIGFEAHYSVLAPNSGSFNRWDFRMYIIPVIPTFLL